MFRSLTSRLLLTYVLVIGTVLALIAVSLALLLINNPVLDRQTQSRLNFLADVLEERDSRLVDELPRERLRAALRSLGASDARLLVLGPDGAIRFDSAVDQSLPPRNELAAVAAGLSANQGVLRGEGGVEWLYAARGQESDRVLLVLTPRPRRPLLTVGDEFLVPLLQAGAVALVLSILLAALISRWVAAPLQRIARAASAVASGDYRQRPQPGGPEEVRRLSHAFTEMVQRVQASQQAQRDFVANVSHELRTPLTSIQGFAQAILDGTAQDRATQEHAAQVIYDESHRLHRLVDDLLDLARLDTGQIEFQRGPIQLEGLLARVAERQRVLADEKGVQLENRVASLPTIVGDIDRLAQVFTNLVDNAIRYTPTGGRVTLDAQAQGSEVVVHIIDSGPGIPEEERSRIFERFYRVEKSRAGPQPRGVGLGLAITHEIVQAHGGRITVESVLSRGSRFSVHLPVVRPQDETLAVRARRA